MYSEDKTVTLVIYPHFTPSSKGNQLRVASLEIFKNFISFHQIQTHHYCSFLILYFYSVLFTSNKHTEKEHKMNVIIKCLLKGKERKQCIYYTYIIHQLHEGNYI